MGKKRGGKPTREGKPKRERKEGDASGWTTYKRENQVFEDYYKAQKIVPEEQWESFVAALRRPLPTTFRVTENTPFTAEIKKKLQIFAQMAATTLDDGTVVEPPKNLEWYPNQGGWYYDVHRHALKRNPELKEFTRFLQVQTDSGNISRQEAVSMIPPMLLRVEPHHRVLDMCAAPGSKTGQIIEFLHANCPAGENPEGMVIANDADFKRCYTLMHQIQRLHSPCILVTNHEAQRFPWLKAQPHELGMKEGDVKEGITKAGKVTFQFDRVLADVPCSGDGTMRKNPDIWDDWGVHKSLGIHKLQLSIAVRGANLLKVGGRMVYSTCSMSPSENEAVVAELIRGTKGALQIVDVSQELPLLKRTPGLHTWKIQDKHGNWHENHADIKDREVSKKIPPSVFPPTAEEAASFHLERCLRLLPHQQDTGGFFVAVLEKVAPTWVSMLKEDDKSEEKTEEKVEKPDDAAKKPWMKKMYPEAPFQPFDVDNAFKSQWESIKQFYGIRDGFPTDLLMTRSDNAVKITLVSRGIKQIWTADDRKDLKIINGGVRVFNNQPGKITVGCEYRITHEGTQHLVPWTTERKIQIALSDFSTLLTETDPLTCTFSEKAANAMAATSKGCVLLQIDPTVEQPWGGYSMAAWMAKVSCHFQVAKEDLEMLRSLARHYGLIPEKEEKREETKAEEKKEEEKMEEEKKEGEVKVEEKTL
ncbi:hypothetical protein PROFUN_03363 [Planoprotostelium fungivorum]|uniref:SAM-dependent MTase RsmB/NOP-type domain-containing protein n=1 Tax=Planoprotostelium fungivorum TaxID=1890364 RepID=A0A2P6NWB1_9EUKA|nr:hypothetical protein PROFUN_03363 [Planoprotostelium fungivorum]